MNFIFRMQQNYLVFWKHWIHRWRLIIRDCHSVTRVKRWIKTTLGMIDINVLWILLKLKQGLIISYLFVSYSKSIWSQPVLRFSRVRIPTTARQNGSEVRLVVFTFITLIDDIAFELFAMHCGIGRGKRPKKIPQKRWLCRKHSKLIVSLESPYQPECICFFLNAISSI